MDKWQQRRGKEGKIQTEYKQAASSGIVGIWSKGK